MYARFLYLPFLIFVPTLEAGRDCDSSDGYIRNHQDNVTDNCDYECGWAQCGDVCINAKAGARCYCGEERLDIYSGLHYCCVDQDHSPDNRTHLSLELSCWNLREGHCPQGRVVSMLDTCNNRCFNDYETSAAVGWRSYYRCGDHQCAPAQYMCGGYPLCPDSRDISKCNVDLKCVLGPIFSHNRSALVSDLSSSHQSCDYDIYHNDGQYDTITREDETDLNISSRKVQINYTSITECNTATIANLPGLMCGEQCLQHSTWCLEDNGNSCGKYGTNNKQLCANTTFWAGKTCNRFYDSGRKAALGRRCAGAAQHCIYPWYTSSIFTYQVNKSSQVSNILKSNF